MTKVVITQRIDYISSYGESRDAIDQKLSELVLNAGCLPIPICNNLIIGKNHNKINDQPILNEWLSIVNPEGILLSGGNNIGEHYYRDITEYYLLNWAVKKNIPVLGICRGMQVMVKWSNGVLIKVNNHVSTIHKLNFPNKNIYLPKKVNSYHDWGIIDCPQGFEIMAYTNDGVIEAIKHKKFSWEGWMWHPERNKIFTQLEIERIRSLFCLKII